MAEQRPTLLLVLALSTIAVTPANLVIRSFTDHVRASPKQRQIELRPLQVFALEVFQVAPDAFLDGHNKAPPGRTSCSGHGDGRYVVITAVIDKLAHPTKYKSWQYDDVAYLAEAL